jgi:hypothetical protein
LLLLGAHEPVRLLYHLCLVDAHQLLEGELSDLECALGQLKGLGLLLNKLEDDLHVLLRRLEPCYEDEGALKLSLRQKPFIATIVLSEHFSKVELRIERDWFHYKK